MNHDEDDIERFEEELELEMYREYRDVVGMFAYAVETERRFYLANQVELEPRDDAYARIVAGAMAFAVCKATPSRIDRRGLHRSNLWLLRRAVCSLAVPPDYVLIDGFPVRRLPTISLAMKKGDAVTACVAAASIVAKVTRDRMMDRYHRRFPMYGFDHNRGYGTREHWDVLSRLGPTPIHRLSFKGVGENGTVDVETVEDP